MRQEFNGTAKGQFSSRDIINIHNPLAESVSDNEPLLLAQRQRLHQLLDDISVVSGESKKDLWRSVHAHIDVSSIHGITTKKYHKAEEYLVKRLADAKHARECRHLVGEILRLTADKVTDRNKYCMKTFGTRTLNDLPREKLQIAFDYFDKDHDLPQCQSTNAQPNTIDWKELIKTHPKVFIGVFLLGFLTSFLFR